MMDVPPESGFGADSDADFRGEAASVRIRQTMHDMLANSLGLTEAAVEEYIEDYLSGDRAGAVLDAMIEAHDLSSKRVLEVGSGLGNTLLHLIARGVDATGIEPGEYWKEIIAQRLKDRGLPTDRILIGVGEDLPFTDESFDFVLSQQVLEHVNDPERVLVEIKRVLRPGGEVLIAAPNYMSFSENHYRIAWFPGMPARLGAIYLRLRGRNPAFYQQHVNNLTYLQMIRGMDLIGMENVGLKQYIDAWSRPISADYSFPKRMIISTLSILGDKPCRLIYHSRLFFKDEITYIYRKPSR